MAKQKTEAFPYRGRDILLVNLDRETYEFTALDEPDAKALVGGRSLSMELWSRYADWTRLREEDWEAGNPFVVAIGAGSDMDVPWMDGYSLTTRSPVTGRVETYCGNGAMVKVFGGLGISALVIVGRKSRTTRLVIEERKVSFPVDESLHNLRTSALLSRFPDCHAITIGPAAEQQVPFSNLAVDGNPIGRGGVAVVLARKNLKAITFSVHEKERACYHPSAIGKVVERCASMASRFPTRALPYYAKKNGWAAVHGFQDGTDGRLWALEDKEDFIPWFALGANMGTFDPARVKSLVDGARELGLDPSSVSVVMLASLSRIRESESDLWRVMESIAFRRGGFMDLADGVSPDFFTIGKREMVPLDIRSLPSTALLMSMGDDTLVWEEMVHGARLARGRERMFAKRAIAAQDLRFVMESYGIAWRRALLLTRHPLRFFLRPYEKLASIATATEGYAITARDLVAFAKEGWRRQRILDAKVGWKSPGSVPSFFMTTPLDGKVVTLARMRDFYDGLRERESIILSSKS